ncbi:hypothetical protein NK8_53860 (plasmid) [Caballeronia sp. NK8]|nr:hypothetical protein NK8_53860 [Caballeronia sp. NK8]
MCIGNTGPTPTPTPTPNSKLDEGTPSIDGVIKRIGPSDSVITLDNGKTYKLDIEDLKGLRKGESVQLKPFGNPSDMKAILSKPRK